MFRERYQSLAVLRSVYAWYLSPFIFILPSGSALDLSPACRAVDRLVPLREYDCSGAALSLGIAPKPWGERVRKSSNGVRKTDFYFTRGIPRRRVHMASHRDVTSGGLTYVHIQKRFAHATAGSSECTKQPRRDRQGPVPWPDHPARSLQVGPAHHQRHYRPEERLEPARPQRIRGRADRDPAQPAVRGPEIYAAAEPAATADATAADADSA